MSARRLVAVLGVATVLAAGCERSTAHEVDPPPVRPRWQPMELPAPPGAPGRLLVRDVVGCAGRWFAVGGLVDAVGETRPAAWASADGVSWSPLTVAGSSFYGRRHVLFSAACRDGRLAAVGARNGGVHGNPRTGTWAQAADGTLREVVAPFEVYAGPRAVHVSRLAAGPAGWLIAGARVSGAAVWVSADGARFTLREGVPGLAGDGRGRTAAYDAVAVGSGWVVVGSVLPPGATALAPLSWASTDGRAWRRTELPSPDGRGRAQRVAVVGGAAVAVGTAGGSFGVWRTDRPGVVAGPGGDPGGTPKGIGSSGPDLGAGWRWVGGFGGIDGAGSGVASVDGLTVGGGRLVAVTGDGAGHGLWLSVDSGDSWRTVAMPSVVPDGGDSAVAVAVQEDRLVLVADDGRASRAWWAGLSTVDR